MVTNVDKAGAVARTMKVVPIATAARLTGTNGSADPVAADARSIPARILALVDAVASQPPPVDHARVAALRRAIAEGTLRIDSDTIAQAILARLSAKNAT